VKAEDGQDIHWEEVKGHWSQGELIVLISREGCARGGRLTATGMGTMVRPDSRDEGRAGKPRESFLGDNRQFLTKGGD